MNVISSFHSIRILKLFGLVLLLTVLHSCSSSQALKKDLNQTFSSAPAFKHSFSGLVIYDPQERTFLYEHNAAKYFTPASNIKLFTFYTGVKVLGDSIPALKYRKTNDSIIFTGTGDPSFLNPDLPSSTVLDFLKSREEQLFFVPASPAETVLGPGWAWDDYNAYYSAERSDFPLYANQVVFKFQSNQTTPEVYPNFFTDSLLSDSTNELSRVKRNAYNNRFQYPQKQLEKDFTQYVPFKTSASLVAQLLEDTLGRQVQVLKKDPNIEFNEVIYSIPADSVYKQMLEVSDNFIAEQILLMAAGKLSDTLKTSIAIDHMKDVHLQDLPDEVRWVDGSGLSRYNLVTPRSMVKLLEKIKDEVSYQQLFNMLPVGGKTGTLRNRLHAPEPFVFAKTGSLSNNHSVSGYLKTKKGRILIFSFMNSNYTVPSAVLRAEMDQILVQIRDTY